MANRVLTVANHVYSVANRDVANRDCGESRVIPLGLKGLNIRIENLPPAKLQILSFIENSSKMK